MKSFVLSIVAIFFASVCTGQTPKLVKDINPGSGHGNPQELINYNGKLFFTADDDANGREPWLSSGSSGNTSMISDIYPGAGGPFYKRNPTVFDGDVYFIADDGSTGKELWKTDNGSASLVMDIYPGATGSLNQGVSCACLTVAGSLLFFNPRDGAGQAGTHGWELWKTNGNTPELVEDIYPGTNSGLSNHLVALGDKVFFSATDNVHGQELWYSDGSTTLMVKDVNPGSQGSAPEDIVVAGGKVFFSAYHPTYGREMWVSDGTATGTSLVSDIAPGPDDANIEFVYGGSQEVYFNADNGTDGKEMWTSDGNGATMHDINPGSGDSHARFFHQVGNKIFFYAEDGSNGAELWVAKNGNVNMVKNISSGSGSSFPNYFTSVGNGVYFSAASALWYSDGTANGTYEVVGGDEGISTIRATALAGGNLYFTANGYDFNGQTVGYELFVLENVSGINSSNVPELSFQLSPNPASNLVYLNLPNNTGNGSLMVNVYNQLGQRVLQKELISDHLNVSALKSGIYLVEVVTGEKWGRKELIIVR